jgi:methylamine---glutamate N-methyltransferase subunit C
VGVMAKYRCIPCGFIYNEEKEGKEFSELPEDWTCPICGVSKDSFELITEDDENRF